MDILKIVSTIVLPIVLIAAVVYELKRTLKYTNFDERQQIVRGRAFKYAYYTAMIFAAVIIVLEAGGTTIMSAVVFAGLQLYLSFIVFVSYCIFKDAYFTVSEKSAKGYALMLAGLGIINLVGGIIQAGKGHVMENGMLTKDCLGLVVGVSFLFIAVEFVVKKFLVSREEEE